MGRLRPRRDGPVHSDWLTYGSNLLANAGITESRFRNPLCKERFFGSVSLQYWSALMDRARARGITEQDIGHILGLKEITIRRWNRGENVPHPYTIFATLLLVLNEGISNVPLPTNREIIWSAVSRTIAIIRETECGREPCQLTRLDFWCARWFLRHPDSRVFLFAEPDEAAEDIVLDDVLYWLQTEFVGFDISLPTVNSILDGWSDPYLLYHIGLESGSGVLDECI